MPPDERSAAEQLAEFKAALAEVLEPAEPEQPPAEPTTLIEAAHPGAVPVHDDKAFNEVLQASAENFWTGWAL